MDASALIGNAQNAYMAGLQKQATAGAAALGATDSAGTRSAANLKKVRAAAQQFEGFFVGQMTEHMMAGIEPDPVFGGGTGEEMWRSMLNQEYGKQIAKSGKLGIADNVMKAMLHAQEQRSAAITNAADGAAAASTPAADAAATTASTATAPATTAAIATTAAAARFLPVRR